MGRKTFCLVVIFLFLAATLQLASAKEEHAKVEKAVYIRGLPDNLRINFLLPALFAMFLGVYINVNMEMVFDKNLNYTTLIIGKEKIKPEEPIKVKIQGFYGIGKRIIKVIPIVVGMVWFAGICENVTVEPY